ncbi:MAG: ACP S-malonyltransferase [Chloroflexi bacterium]|nr:ACP S-malonyltransferase [Chloroflexota bacterium]MBT5319972.1 ACP S-malonyltransferase [Chloroflexota bacterium]
MSAISQIEKVAYLFPGQGSQSVGMGKDLYDGSKAAKAVFDEIDDTLGRSLTSIMFEGPQEELTKTENAQPAITAVSLAAYKALEESKGSSPDIAMVAGHSLGEYSSLAVAGALSIADTARLVVERGRLMQHACDERPGGMAALLGIDELSVEEICTETGTYISNINTDDQIIVSGDHMALAKAIDLAAARGARKCVPLPVGGAFHSGLMEPARSGLLDVIDSLDWHDPAVPVIANCDARSITTAAEIKEELGMQIMSCVRWSDSIRFMLGNGVRDFVEVGQGKVLAGMMRRIDREANMSNISDMESVVALAS